MTAKQYLNQIYTFDRLIEIQNEKIEQLRTRAEGSAVRYDRDKVQTSGSQDPLGDASVNLMAEMRKRDMYIARRKAITDKIESLAFTDNSSYLVLAKRYILKKSDKEIAFEMDYTLRHVSRLFSRAFKVFESEKMS